jgi:type IV secretory pathway VirB10-like protein
MRAQNRDKKPINPDWQHEYNRWYGRANTPRPGRQGMHWSLRLTIYSVVAITAYTTSKQLLYPEPKPTVSQAPTPSRTVESAAPPKPPAPPPKQEPPIVIANESQRVQYQTAPPSPPAPQQPGIDPYTAAFARQADERIARQNAEAQAQQSAINRRALNNGRCAELANDRNIITEWLRTAGSDADRARFRVLLQANQSDMLRTGC